MGRRDGSAERFAQREWSVLSGYVVWKQACEAGGLAGGRFISRAIEAKTSLAEGRYNVAARGRRKRHLLCVDR